MRAINLKQMKIDRIKKLTRIVEQKATFLDRRPDAIIFSNNKYLNYFTHTFYGLVIIDNVAWVVKAIIKAII